MTLDESIGLWKKEHKHEIVHACNMDVEVHEIVDRVNPWHTGDPTEEGDYLCVFQSIWDVEYYWCYWDGAWNIYFDDYDPDTYTIVAWQKITYKEKEK